MDNSIQNAFLSKKQTSENIETFLYKYKNILSSDQYAKLCVLISDMVHNEYNVHNFNICIYQWKLLYCINPEDTLSEYNNKLIINNICDIINSAVTIRCKNELVNSIFNIAWYHIPYFQADAILILLWACSKLKFEKYNVPKTEYYIALKNGIVRNIHNFNDKQIITILSACAELEFIELGIDLNEVADYFVWLLFQNLEKYTVTEYSKIIYSIAKLKIYQSYCQPHIMYYTSKYLHNFNPHELANVIWSLAKLKIDITTIKNDIKNQVSKCKNQFKMNDFTNIIWSFSVLNIPIKNNGDIMNFIKNNVSKFNAFQLKYTKIACIKLKIDISDIHEFNT
jgi:hypothetical protein